MAEFSVELVGGPHAGRRALKSRRRHPPDEIPVVIRSSSEDAAGTGDADEAATKTVAIYRYSHRDDERDALVYSYEHDREAPRRRRR